MWVYITRNRYKLEFFFCFCLFVCLLLLCFFLRMHSRILEFSILVCTTSMFTFRSVGAWERGYIFPQSRSPLEPTHLLGLVLGVCSMDVDSRRIKRGQCTECGCVGYSGGANKMKCINCGHAPGKHYNLSSVPSGSQASTLGMILKYMCPRLCLKQYSMKVELKEARG